MNSSPWTASLSAVPNSSGVGDTLVGADAVPRLDAVVGPARHHAPAGQVDRLRLELLEFAVRPAAAEEEDDPRPPVRLLPARREVDHQPQLRLLGFLVDER